MRLAILLLAAMMMPMASAMESEGTEVTYGDVIIEGLGGEEFTVNIGIKADENATYSIELGNRSEFKFDENPIVIEIPAGDTRTFIFDGVVQGEDGGGIADGKYVMTWEAFKDGVFIGPTIYPAGNPIAAVGGHGIDDYAWPATIAINGPKEMRKAVREHVRMGVNWIKIMADELKDNEIIAAVQIAHQNNVKVVAHAAEEGAYRAIKAGVDCIEHGYDLSDRTLRLMAKKGTYYDPTIVCNLSAEYITEREEKIAELDLKYNQDVIDGRILVAYADERSPSRALKQRKILLRAQELGVKITVGADSNPLGEIGLLEIEQLVFSGMTEMQAIIAATKNSAEMSNVLETVGTIEEGKIADLIVLADNPLKHISNIRKLKMVLKNGKKVDISFPDQQTSFWKLYFKEFEKEE